MQPIVNGLENKYSKNFDFQRVNASTDEGSEIYKSYTLFGHPAFLILNQEGDILWQGVGEQSADVLEDVLKSVLSEN